MTPTPAKLSGSSVTMMPSGAPASRQKRPRSPALAALNDDARSGGGGLSERADVGRQERVDQVRVAQRPADEADGEDGRRVGHADRAAEGDDRGEGIQGCGDLAPRGASLDRRRRFRRGRLDPIEVAGDRPRAARGGDGEKDPLDVVDLGQAVGIFGTDVEGAAAGGGEAGLMVWPAQIRLPGMPTGPSLIVAVTPRSSSAGPSLPVIVRVTATAERTGSKLNWPPLMFACMPVTIPRKTL